MPEDKLPRREEETKMVYSHGNLACAALMALSIWFAPALPQAIAVLLPRTESSGALHQENP